MEFDPKTKTVSQAEFRADPGAIVKMAKDGPVTVLAADGKSKAAVIAIPRVDAEGRVTLGSVEQIAGDGNEPPTTY